MPPAYAKRLRPTAWGAVSSVAIATRLQPPSCLRHGNHDNAVTMGRSAGNGEPAMNHYIDTKEPFL
jgi:hypothetical protein